MLSVLSSTVWTPTLSEAFPVTVTFAYGRTVEFEGKMIAICGGIVSDFGSPGSTFTRIGTDRVSDPLVPITSTWNGPGVLPLRTQIAVPEPGMLVGEQTAVTPAGSEVAVRLTALEKPPVARREIVAVAESFTTNETLFGFAVKEKSGTNTRTSIVVERTSDPLVPEIVTTYVPALFAVSVHVEVSLPVRLDGTHEVVTPVGTETA